MTGAASIAAAPWLADRRLQRLFAALARDGDEAWAVGGAVRNTLMGLPVNDVDVATTALPEVVSARAAAAGFKPVPTGLDHGTVTVVVDGHPFEVTTLREDIETHGRHAVVRFGRDWRADAHRRDFTMNALYVSADGTVHDFVGGVEDCLARRVRFIGRPEDRIREDYLRILRFFRFHAAYGHGDPDPAGLAACIRERAGLDRLSAERIGQETVKLVAAPGAPATARVMSDCGLLQRVLGSAADLAGFARLTTLARDMVVAPQGKADWPLFLAALAVWTEADAPRLAERLRLPNAALDRMERGVHLARAVGPGFDDRRARALLYRAGEESYRDALALAAARRRITDEGRLAHDLALPFRWQPGKLPVAGRDFLARGLARGPSVGEALRRAEALWIESDFALSRDDLLGAVPESPAGSRPRP
ncbi:CCA tRNA nucleotidyltransferase [Prosthecomicrobium sp. N25]|uniref:CCA tRNA nucleotidyltransferase n=1 Tax=Prosthecomicrobium sp. N25 TaxID=3129254 RepID=UPI0030774DE8